MSNMRLKVTEASWRSFGRTLEVTLYLSSIWMSHLRTTVCFFSFVKFYDDVTQKVVEMIDFRKMSLEGIVDAFYDM